MARDDDPARTREVPRATYLIQLHAGFQAQRCNEFFPYLADLGISRIYCSPYQSPDACHRRGTYG